MTNIGPKFPNDNVRYSGLRYHIVYYFYVEIFDKGWETIHLFVLVRL